MVIAALLLLLLASTAEANELTVDKRTLQLDDTVTITLTLEGSFAAIDSVRIPAQNLIVDEPPSVSTEFQWINGETSRRKIFRYTAHAKSAGGALVGPLTLRSRNGEVETLVPIALQVVPDAAAGSSDPLRVMRELVATNRDPIFVIAQTDKSEVFENEEVVVTWTLYNGASVQQYSFGQVPKLDDFWSEEMDVRYERPQEVVLAGVPMQKLVIRRVALFPLRSGKLTVPAMTVNASIMKRSSAGDPFGLFEGVLADVHRRSPDITIIARPIPPGPPVTAIGQATLRCQPPVQRNGGPISMDVTLSARANLRAAEPPRWKSAVKGSSQVIDRGLNVYAVSNDRWMMRRWRYVIFPAHDGRFVLPALSTLILTPTGERREIDCQATTLQVVAGEPGTPHAPSSAPRLNARPYVPALLTALAVTLLAALSIARARNRLRLRAQVRALLRPTLAETRAAVEAELAARGVDPMFLIREASDAGDAFRAFRSLIDAAERDRIHTTERVVGHRIRDVLIAVPPAIQSMNDRDATADAAPLHGG